MWWLTIPILEHIENEEIPEEFKLSENNEDSEEDELLELDEDNDDA